MTNDAELAEKIVRRCLGVRDGEELKDFFVSVKVSAHPGLNRSAIIRPSHMIRDAMVILNEESAAAGRAD